MKYPRWTSGAALLAVLAAACSGQNSANQPARARQDSLPRAATIPGATSTPQVQAPQSPAKPAAATPSDIGLREAAFDPKAKPCDDFYQHSCGGWLASAQVDTSTPAQSRVLELKRDQAARRRRLLVTARAGHPDAAMAKLGAYYRSCTDESSLAATGHTAIAPLLSAASAVKDARSLASALALLHRHRLFAGFALGTAPDFRSPTQLLYLDRGLLGLADREAYVRFGHHVKTRDDYRKHVARVLTLAGEKSGRARRSASRVLALEIDLAQETMILGQRRNVARLSRRVSRAGLAKLARHFDWKTYFAELGVPAVEALAVTTPRYMRLVGKLSRNRFADWRSYLTYHVARATADMVGGPLRAEIDSFLTAESPGFVARSSEQRCIDDMRVHMGHLMAYSLAASHFSDADAKAARALVSATAAGLADHVAQAAWLAPATRTAAADKLSKIALLVGRPAAAPVDTLSLDAGNYASNALAARGAMTRRDLDTVGKPVSRTAWIAPADTVDVIYNWLANQLTVPAGVLAPPFYSPKHARAVNLGALALLVGNEITHAIDRGGALFDGDGRLRTWWSRSDEQAYGALASCFVDQFNGYRDASTKVDGNQTLRENMADLSGARAAFRAHRKTPSPTVGEFTGDRQFFVAMAQTWCTKMTDAEAKRRKHVSTHAPARHRINGVVANMPEFAAAFQCAPDAPMVRAKTCTAW